MKKIMLVAGARPNFMKIAPIIRELQKHADTFQFQLVHTGQHYDREMSDVFFDELEIPKPDHYLEVGSGSHAQQTAKVMTRFESVCDREKPDLVLVVGDVNSTLACAIAAKKLNIRLAHVEAGLRSHDRSMPEEINRVVTDAISDYFFVTEKSGVDNLLAEGKTRNAIFFVGHVMIDNLFHQMAKLESAVDKIPEIQYIKERYPEYGIVTLHRPSNADDRDTLKNLAHALAEIAERIPLIFPIHPRTQMNLSKFGIRLPNSVITIKPLGYMAFLDLIKNARLVLTDSGGIQEETTAMGIPCLTLRENTERPVTVEEGTNTVVGTDPARIVTEAEEILGGSGKRGKIPDLWDGKAAERLVCVLTQQWAD